MELKGRIFNIQRFSVHDGPGVRDTIFMKGCPLRCLWCSNPESQSFAPQIGWRGKKCIGCGACLEACPEKALSRAEDGAIVRDTGSCTLCLACVKVCYAQAMHVYGEEYTVDEVYAKVRNQPMAWRSDGGVTVSGGEPLSQADFVGALLEKFRRYSLHTAIETTLYAPFENVAKVVPHASLVYADMKFFSDEKHRKYTGVGNERIKANLKRLKTEFPGAELVVRTPLIPGINDDDAELDAIVDFLRDVPGLDDYELLPFHAFGQPKYEQLGLEYAVKDIVPPDKEEVEKRNNVLRERLGLRRKEAVTV